MKIAQVAPLYESCPPRLYGGTERVVSYLTEELVRQGHDVTLFASGDSETSSRLHAPCAHSLRLNAGDGVGLAYHLVMLHHVRSSADAYDIIHFHADYLHFPLFADRPEKTLTTVHGRMDLQELPIIFGEFQSMPVVSVSDSQRRPLPWANWRGTVYHGLPTELYAPGPGRSGYLAFIGRICPEKRPDRMIAIAKGAGVPLKIAAKVDKVDVDYFDDVIKPLLDDPLIEFVGEISDAEKEAFLGDALALLFTIGWPEPFGLAMIEAMACGTPVIAWRNGSVPEVVEEGVTGFIVAGIDEAVEAIERVSILDRAVVRKRFEERFSVERMARAYLSLYESAASGPGKPAVAKRQAANDTLFPVTAA